MKKRKFNVRLDELNMVRHYTVCFAAGMVTGAVQIAWHCRENIIAAIKEKMKIG